MKEGCLYTFLGTSGAITGWLLMQNVIRPALAESPQIINFGLNLSEPMAFGTFLVYGPIVFAGAGILIINALSKGKRG